MSEGALWSTARERLGPYGLLHRVENAVEVGTPDVAYVLRVPARSPASGWLELKHLDAWPARAATAVNVPHLTQEQQSWIATWHGHGGLAHVLLQAADEYLLLCSVTVCALFRRELTRAQLVDAAAVHGRGAFPTRGIVGYLTRPCDEGLHGRRFM